MPPKFTVTVSPWFNLTINSLLTMRDMEKHFSLFMWALLSLHLNLVAGSEGLRISEPGLPMQHVPSLRIPFNSIHQPPTALTRVELLSLANVSTECMNAWEKTWNSSARTKVLDAFGKPDAGILVGNWNWFGHYDECMSMDQLNYCMTMIQVALPNMSIAEASQGSIIKWGVCVPEVCSDSDVLNALTTILEMVELPLNTSVISALRADCVKTPPIPYDAGFIVFVAISSILLLVIVIATGYDVMWTYITRRKNSYQDLLIHSQDDGNLGDDEMPRSSTIGTNVQGNIVTTASPVRVAREQEPQGLVVRFLLSFAVNRNLPKLLKCEVSPKSIACLNGIRVISMTWVILGHSFLALSVGGVAQNPLTGLGWLKDFSFQPILNAFPSVDSFFFLSGLLVAYTTLGHMVKTEGKIPWHWFYIHRYLRLTPALGMVILIQMYLCPFLGRGPIWMWGVESPQCQKYWWADLLYINNFYPTNMDDACISWVWYLANDMQFYIISPIILIPLYRKPVIGLIIMAVMCVGSVVTTAMLMVHYNFSANFLSIQTSPETGPTFQNVIYSKPYCRIQPYLVGMLLGYLLHRKGTNLKAKFHPSVVSAGWAMAAAIAMAVVYGLYGSNNGHELSTAESALYMSLNRVAWACSLSWVVVACTYGYGGWVNDFLSWKLWIPLSRLTYGAYLLHPIIISILSGSVGTAIYLKTSLIATYFVAFVILAFSSAGLLAMVVEYPFANLEKLMLPK